MGFDRARPLRVRFAPSPTGSLHLGNARTALFNWLLARQSGGRFVLRIEDTDVERHREGSVEEIAADLRWLGLDWDEGPDVGGPFAPYRQSERGEQYARAAASLLEAGRAYRCFCDGRGLGGGRGAAPRYSGRCGALARGESDARAAAGEPFALRFRITPEGFDIPGREVVFHDRLRGSVRFPVEELGDPVIVRRDGRPTYNYAVVVDDATMRIDLVMRGDDHLSNTPRQVLLFEALGWTVPEFVHLPLVRGEDGERLSKRHGAVSVVEYRRRGYPAEGMLNALALLGWSPGPDRSIVGRDELLREFDVDRVGLSAATFDRSKLEWVCAQHLRRIGPERLAGLVGAFLQREGRLPEPLPAGAVAWLCRVTELIGRGLSHVAAIVERAEPLFARGGEPRTDAARRAVCGEGGSEVIEALVLLAGESPPDTGEAWQRMKEQLRRRTGRRGRALFQPVRVALSGEVSGPELDLLVPLISEGARLFAGHVVPVDERARRTARWLAARGR